MCRISIKRRSTRAQSQAWDLLLGAAPANESSVASAASTVSQIMGLTCAGCTLGGCSAFSHPASIVHSRQPLAALWMVQFCSTERAHSHWRVEHTNIICEVTVMESAHWSDVLIIHNRGSAFKGLNVAELLLYKAVKKVNSGDFSTERMILSGLF